MITNPDPILCNKGDTLSSVLVEAMDLDRRPYSIPFIFELGADHDGSWKLKDTTGKDRGYGCFGWGFIKNVYILFYNFSI